jgi:hypothetical protein
MVPRGCSRPTAAVPLGMESAGFALMPRFSRDATAWQDDENGQAGWVFLGADEL